MLRFLSAVSILLVSAVSLTAASAPATSTPAPANTPAQPPAQPAATPAPASEPAATPPAAVPKITYSQCHVDGKYVAMTFDDGPHKVNTPRLLDMLKERNIHVTFFLVGENAAEYPDLVKRELAEGHEVGNHSWSHPQLSIMGDAVVREQLQKTQDAINHATGLTPNLMRPPYGAFTARQKNWAHGEFGFKVILWDVDPEDWKYLNAEHVKKEILKAVVPGSIVLSHDIHKTTIDAMPEVLDTLIAKGYKFVTVSELIAMDRPATPKPKATPKSSPAAKQDKDKESADSTKTAEPAPAKP